MAVRSPLRSLARLQKVEKWFNQCASYTGDNVDNVVVLVRLEVANPGQEQEMRIELEPDGPEEAAVLAIVDAACQKKTAKAEAELDKHGFERTSRGVRVKGAPVTPK